MRSFSIFGRSFRNAFADAAISTIVLVIAITGNAYGQEPTPTVVLPAVDAAQTDRIDAYLEASTTTPRIGAPFLLTIFVEVEQNASIIAWPALPAEDPVYEIVSVGDLRTQNRNDRVLYSQELEVRLWRTGAFLSPELIVGVSFNGEVLAGLVRSVYFEVPALLNESPDRNLRPALLTIGLPYIPSWIWASGILALTLIVSLLVFAIRGSTRSLIQITQGTPYQIALAQLEDLKSQDITPDLLYSLATSCVREYLSHEPGLSASEMTTQEIVSGLRSVSWMSRAQRQGLQQLFEQADLVKFARMQPDRQASQRFLDYAIKWLTSAQQSKERTAHD